MDQKTAVAHQRLDGYRDHATMESTQAILKSVFALTPDTELITTVQAVYAPVALDPGGAPVFDGRGTGWVFLRPGSRHVPSVSGHRMNLIYFLPGGAVEWHT